MVERPTTPISRASSQSGSAHSTPSKSVNENGKRQMQQLGPSKRKGEHLKTVRGALERWRLKVHRDRYTIGSAMPTIILPDHTLTTLASNARIKTVDDMVEKLDPPWVMAQRHGLEVLELMAKLDSRERAQKEQEKQARAAVRKAETKAREAERKRVADAAKAVRDAEKAVEKAKKERLAQIEKQRREEEKAEKKRRQEAILAAKKKRPRKPVMVGSTSFNVSGASTPAQSSATGFAHSLQSSPASTMLYSGPALSPIHSPTFYMSNSPITPATRPRPQPTPITESNWSTWESITAPSTPLPAIIPAPPRPQPRPAPIPKSLSAQPSEYPLPSTVSHQSP